MDGLDPFIEAAEESGLNVASIAEARTLFGISTNLLDDVAPLPVVTMNGKPVEIELPEAIEATTDHTIYAESADN